LIKLCSGKSINFIPDELTGNNRIEMIALIALAGTETTHNALLHTIKMLLTDKRLVTSFRNGNIKSILKEALLHH
jgi:cytochrome P450